MNQLAPFLKWYKCHQNLKTMNPKKSPEVSLENRRLTNLFVGAIVTLSLILISFEWSMPEGKGEESTMARDIQFDMKEMVSIPREEAKPTPEKTLPTIMEVIELVPDDIEIGDVEFTTEVTRNSWYDYKFDETDPVEVINEAPIPFVDVHDKPLFNGGDPGTEFTKYIGRHLRYPEVAAENGVYGLVIVQFVIDETGSLTDLVVLRSVDPALDNEALRVIQSSPKWTPGKQRNKPVKVIYTCPINFRLQ